MTGVTFPASSRSRRTARSSRFWRARCPTGQPGQVIAQLAGGHHGLLAGGHVPDGDGADLLLRAAVDQRPARALVAGPFELAAELAGRAQVDARTQPGR